MRDRNDNDSADGTDAEKRRGDNGIGKESVGLVLAGKQCILHTSRWRKLHNPGGIFLSIQVLERAILLLLFHVEVFD